jgi:uncharacterized membrane protein YfcA
MTPLLILVFGTAPVTAVGSDITYAAVTKSVGGWRHLRLKTVNLELSAWLALGSVPAAIAGVWVIEWLHERYGSQLDDIVLTMLAIALIVVGVIVLGRALFAVAAHAREREHFTLTRAHKIAAVAIGASTGFVIGLTSAGSGTLIAIALIAIFRLTPQRVVGTDVFHAAVLLWAAGVAHWLGGNIDFLLAGTILLGSVPGVILGTNLSVKAPQKFLRYALAVVLIASGTTLILKEGSPDVVIPAIGVATVMIGVLFGAQALSRGGSKRGADATAGAAAS